MAANESKNQTLREVRSKKLEGKVSDAKTHNALYFFESPKVSSYSCHLNLPVQYRQ
jgi:hypothetical protein